MTRRCIVVIPAFDEAASIADVIRRVPRQLPPDLLVEVLVVDDGSQDGTSDLAVAAGADHVYVARANRGLGAAIRFGLKRAAELGADVAVMIDADGEYAPEDLAVVLGPILEGRAEYVLGSRFADGAPREMRLVRRAGNRVFTALQRVLLGQPLTDGQTGMRAFSRAALQALDVIYAYNYAQVLTLNLARQGFRPVEVPIGYRVRRAGASFITWKYVWRVPLGMLHELATPPVGRGSRGSGGDYLPYRSGEAPEAGPTARPRNVGRWAAFTAMVAAVFGLLVLRHAYAGAYVVEPDARQHVFWMARFLDPGYFPGDPIADYLQRVAPPGYTSFYQALAALGVDPLDASKLLPPALGVVAAAYAFGLAMRILPVPPAACLAAILVVQHLWTQVDLISGTPRAFMFPLFLAFLYHLVRGHRVAVALLVLAEAAFYPQFVLVMAGVLALWPLGVDGGRPTWRRNRLGIAAGGAVAAGLGLLPYALQTSGYGPVLSAAEAWTMAEFHPTGTKRFFNPDPWMFWVTGHRSGAFSAIDSTTPALAFALALPFLLRAPGWFPLATRVGEEVHVLGRAAVAALVVFGMAHAAAFRLYLPNRYANLTLGLVMALAAGLALALLADAVARHLGARRRRLVPAGVVAIAIAAAPTTVGDFPRTSYQHGGAPEVYRFLASTPRDALVSTIAFEGINLPTFARRSVVAARGFGNPYHLGFYRPFRERSVAQLRAHYTPSLAELVGFLDRYGVDYVLVDRTAFHRDYLATEQWLRQLQPAAGEAMHRVESGIVPALARVAPSAEVLATGWQVLLDAEAIRRADALPPTWPPGYWYR